MGFLCELTTFYMTYEQFFIYLNQEIASDCFSSVKNLTPPPTQGTLTT